MPLQQTAFWKHGDKKRNCSNRAISPFVTMFQLYSIIVLSLKGRFKFVSVMFSRSSAAEMSFVGKSQQDKLCLKLYLTLSTPSKETSCDTPNTKPSIRNCSWYVSMSTVIIDSHSLILTSTLSDIPTSVTSKQHTTDWQSLDKEHATPGGNASSPFIDGHSVNNHVIYEQKKIESFMSKK